MIVCYYMSRAKDTKTVSLEQHCQGVDGYGCHGDLDNIMARTDQEERGWYIRIDIVRVRGGGYQH